MVARSAESLPPISRSVGSVVEIVDGAEMDLDSHGLKGIIQLSMDECSPADCIFYVIKSKTINEKHEVVWQDIKKDHMILPWKDSFQYDFRFAEYPHFGEDYYQAVLFSREPHPDGFVLTVYVASREIGEIAPLPTPVHIIKFELHSESVAANSAAPKQLHFVPVAMGRTKGVYGNAQVAIFCEVGLEPPSMRLNLADPHASPHCPDPRHERP